MSKKLTTEKFIEKSRLKHGDRYDYSKTVYINQTTPVVIICPNHGEFLQRPNNHYSGAGCPICSRNKKHTLESFTTKANEIHNNKYNYSEVDYKNNKSKVTIICSEHGRFEQTPDKHLQGEGCPLCSQQKLEDTNIKKYGVLRPLQNESIYDRFQKTCLKKYGVENPSMNNDIKQKRVNTCIDRYNVNYSVQAALVREKKEKTCQLRYGGNSPFCSDAVRAKAIQTNFAKYGVTNSMHLSENLYKIVNTKRKNNTFNTSKPEEKIYEMLCEKFGANDVDRQHSSEKYRYACDFYIISRDMYIELNALWTHGNHWFGTCENDNDLKNKWLNKNTDYYNNAVSVWTDKDVRKRESARENQLNYIVFWDHKLRDAELWFAMDCPDSQDWDREYSWLPKRIIKPDVKSIALTGTHSNISAIAKNYQCDVFYRREIDMWNKNDYYQNLPLHVWIYYNRYKYLGKLPFDLSDAEILRAFTISGVHKGYTVFDISLMQTVINKYNIKSVYDPCAGWGERMLCCYSNNIAYQGMDINRELENGHSAIIRDYDMHDQSIVYMDSAGYFPENDYDAVITCPPYYNTEIYSDKGSENYDYEHFLQWWAIVVKTCSKIRYFCFQINNRYKSDMMKIVEDNGFALIDELTFANNKSSHFTRNKGINLKHESEMMLVFENKSKKVEDINNVRELREHLNMSQSEFAEYFGVSLRSVQSWEQRQRNVPLYVFEAFKKIVMYEEMLKIRE